MDEYIKREDALDAVLFAMSGTGYQSRAISAIHDVPTADVVPKSEVAPKRDRYYIEEGKPPVLIETSDNRRSKIAREIIEDLVAFVDKKERIVQRYWETTHYVNSDDLTDFIAELKKKYTEGEK